MIKNLYQKIFIQNIKSILKEIKSEANEDNDYCIHIAFKTKSVKIPKWLREKYPKYITIVLQNCFENLSVKNTKFEVTLFFSDIPVKIEIPFVEIISISDIKFGFLSAYDSTEEDLSKKQETKILNFQDIKDASL